MIASEVCLGGYIYDRYVLFPISLFYTFILKIKTSSQSPKDNNKLISINIKHFTLYFDF